MDKIIFPCCDHNQDDSSDFFTLSQGILQVALSKNQLSIHDGQSIYEVQSLAFSSDGSIIIKIKNKVDIMDKIIKKDKKKMDVMMESLVKKDVPRDKKIKKCDMMMKKKKKK
jgi:hypothetical protein